jgi:thiamine pyrophosphokinase
MFGKITEYKENRKNRQSLESFLLSKDFIIHDVKNKGNTVVYNKNMKTVIIHHTGEKNGVKTGNLKYDIGGEEQFNINFIPTSVMIFECLLKEANKINNN